MKKLSIITALILVFAMALVGCSQGTTPKNSPSGNSGSVTAVGSTALQPLAQEAATEFMAKYPGSSIQVQGGGSGTGLTQVASGACTIGNSDVFAAEKLPANQAAALVDHKVCVAGFATVVNSQVSVTNLTAQQLIDIFTGKIKNWKDVGGNDLAIVILNRPASSGTRATFKKYALNGAEEATGIALTEESSGTIKQALNSTAGAISYLALSYVDSKLKTLQYNGVAPTVANIENGTYPIWSYEHMYTKGEATGTAKSFIDFMTSSDFASKITQLGYIPIAAMKVSR